MSKKGQKVYQKLKFLFSKTSKNRTALIQRTRWCSEFSTLNCLKKGVPLLENRCFWSKRCKNEVFGLEDIFGPEELFKIFHNCTLRWKSTNHENEIFSSFKDVKRMKGKMRCFKKSYFWHLSVIFMIGLVARFKMKQRFWSFFRRTFWKFNLEDFWRKLKMLNRNWKNRYIVPLDPIFKVALDACSLSKSHKSRFSQKRPRPRRSNFRVFSQNHDFWRSEISCTKMTFLCKNMSSGIYIPRFSILKHALSRHMVSFRSVVVFSDLKKRQKTCAEKWHFCARGKKWPQKWWKKEGLKSSRGSIVLRVRWELRNWTSGGTWREVEK